MTPAFLDDPELSVTLGRVNASLAFERASRQHHIDAQAAREARSAANRKGPT